MTYYKVGLVKFNEDTAQRDVELMNSEYVTSDEAYCAAERELYDEDSPYLAAIIYEIESVPYVLKKEFKISTLYCEEDVL